MPRHLRHPRVVQGPVAPDQVSAERAWNSLDLERAAEPPASAVAVVIAERHVPMRRTLRAVIDAERDLVLTADTADLAFAETAVRHASSPVLVLDAALVAGPLPEAVGELRARVSPVPVVVLLIDALPALAERVLHAGASGVVLKERADSELADAVRTAADGKGFLSIALRAPLARGAGFHGHTDGLLRIFASRQAG